MRLVPSPDVVHVVGEIDLANAETLARALEGDGPVIVDCGSLTFIDAIGLNVLASAAEYRSVTIREAPPFLWRLVALTKLDEILEMEPCAKDRHPSAWVRRSSVAAG